MFFEIFKDLKQEGRKKVRIMQVGKPAVFPYKRFINDDRWRYLALAAIRAQKP